MASNSNRMEEVENYNRLGARPRAQPLVIGQTRTQILRQRSLNQRLAQERLDSTVISRDTRRMTRNRVLPGIRNPMQSTRNSLLPPSPRRQQPDQSSALRLPGSPQVPRRVSRASISSPMDIRQARGTPPRRAPSRTSLTLSTPVRLPTRLFPVNEEEPGNQMEERTPLRVRREDPPPSVTIQGSHDTPVQITVRTNHTTTEIDINNDSFDDRWSRSGWFNSLMNRIRRRDSLNEAFIQQEQQPEQPKPADKSEEPETLGAAGGAAAGGSDYKKSSCPVCFDSIDMILGGGGVLSSTPCGHVFCHACISDSVMRYGSCPLCRKRLTQWQIIKLHFN